jgi:hypothetical protein
MNNLEQAYRTHAGLFTTVARQFLAPDKLEELVTQLRHKTLYHNDHRLKLVNSEPTDVERDCAAHRITLRRKYNKSKSLLKLHAAVISNQINKALDLCDNQAEKALWIQNELAQVAGIVIDTQSDFHVTELKIRCCYWLRQRYLRIAKEEALHYEQLIQRVGHDKRYATSDQAVHQRAQQLKDHKMHLSRFGIRCGNEVKSLADIMNSTRKRVSELYCLSLGIDKMARSKDMRYMMITLTCPPHMHPRPTTQSSWDQTRAKQAYQFLNKSNEAVKRRLANQGISFSEGDAFGIIVSEPHSDGTPHLHILMYHQPDHEALIIDEYRKQFHWHERAVDFSIEDTQREDAARGSSYLFKYLSDSFYEPGDAVNDEDTGKRSKAQRIAAWRSQINARAFRTFGLRRCITLWRQCRKLKSVKDQCGPILQAAVSAACGNDFQKFYHLAANVQMIKQDRPTRYGETYQAIRGLIDHEAQTSWLTSGTCQIIDLRKKQFSHRLGVKLSGPREPVLTKDQGDKYPPIFVPV